MAIEEISVCNRDALTCRLLLLNFLFHASYLRFRVVANSGLLWKCSLIRLSHSSGGTFSFRYKGLRLHFMSKQKTGQADAEGSLTERNTENVKLLRGLRRTALLVLPAALPGMNL